MIRSLQGLAGHVPPGMSILYDPIQGFGWTDPRGWQVRHVSGDSTPANEALAIAGSLD